MRLAHCLEEVAHAFEAVLGVRGSVVHHRDHGGRGQLRGVVHLRLLNDQGSFPVNGCRSRFDLGLEGFEGSDLFIVHVALLSSSDIGQGACVFDQGGFASLKLTQLLAHWFISRNEKAAWSE